jgi:hypothetical protein
MKHLTSTHTTLIAVSVWIFALIVATREPQYTVLVAVISSLILIAVLMKNGKTGK